MNLRSVDFARFWSFWWLFNLALVLLLLDGYFQPFVLKTHHFHIAYNDPRNHWELELVSSKLKSSTTIPENDESPREQRLSFVASWVLTHAPSCEKIWTVRSDNRNLNQIRKLWPLSISCSTLIIVEKRFQVLLHPVGVWHFQKQQKLFLRDIHFVSQRNMRIFNCWTISQLQDCQADKILHWGGKKLCAQMQREGLRGIVCEPEPQKWLC